MNRKGSGPSADTESARTLTLDFQSLELRNKPLLSLSQPVCGALLQPEGTMRSPCTVPGTAEVLSEWQVSRTEGSGHKDQFGPPALRESRRAALTLGLSKSGSLEDWTPRAKKNIWI